MAQGLSTPNPSLSPTHLSIRRGRTTTTHYTHHQIILMVSRNTTLVPSVGLCNAHWASLWGRRQCWHVKRACATPNKKERKKEKRLLRAHGTSEDCIKASSILLSWPGWCMLVQLGGASALQVTWTSWTDFLTDANVSITAIRPLHVSLNSLIQLTNLSSTLLCLTVIMYCVTSCVLIKADDTNLDRELTVSPWCVNCPFTITVILSHYAVQWRLLIVINALLFVNCLTTLLLSVV